MKKVATKWKERAKQDRSNREQIRQSQIKILEDMAMNKELKIEVGKFYRTKSGKKARIYATDGNSSDLIHGAFLDERGWTACVWANDGGTVFGENIISELQELLDFNPFDLPSWAKWIAMEPNRDRDWYFYMDKPELHDEEWYSDETFAIIPPQVAPKDFQGNWEESLHNVSELKRQYKAEKL